MKYVCNNKVMEKELTPFQAKQKHVIRKIFHLEDFSTFHKKIDSHSG